MVTVMSDKVLGFQGPIYTVRFLWYATSLRQAYKLTYDCRNILKMLRCFFLRMSVVNLLQATNRTV